MSGLMPQGSGLMAQARGMAQGGMARADEMEVD
eukprot:CAMPEP_0180321812 /NCGR_PEP_ID=MMETSP0988-20121125/36346_1 /TAXON_ID=697907 /ORGANISM="non described non described, Strain CCMP2293" /LENGTH=32 /DNA_ID= /DNA_START= /DNA_END= /DNA_ORIENTATION=